MSRTLKLILIFGLLVISSGLWAAESLTWEEKYKDQAVQELSYERNVEIFSDYTWREKKVQRFKLLKMEALKNGDFGEFITQYNPRYERATLSAKIIFKNGKRFHYNKAQDKSKSGTDAVYLDERDVTLTLPRIEIGSEIEIMEKRRCHNPIVPGHFSEDYFAEHYFKPLKHMRLSITIPKGIFINISSLNGLGPPIVRQLNKKTTYSWVLNDLDSSENENATPPLEEMARRVIVTTWKDWADLDRYFAPMINQAILGTPEIKELAQEITKNSKTIDEKIQVIFNFIDDAIRYVSVNLGQNGLIPHAPLETLRNRYGDCKDRTALAIALLREINVKAYPVLVAPVWPDIRPEAPTWMYFNHMIPAVECEGLHFVESTDGGYPYKERHPGLDGNQVYIVDGKGGRQLTLPWAEITKPDENSRTELWLQEDGSARLNYDVENNREGVSGIRQTLRELYSMPEEQMKHKLGSLVAGVIPGLEGISFQIEGYQERFGKISAHFSGFQPSAAIPNGPYLLYSQKVIDSREDFPDQERKHPLWFKEQGLIRGTTIIHLPEGYFVEYCPKDVKLRTAEAEISRTWSQKENILTVIDEEKKIAGRYPKEAYKGYRSAIVQLNKETSEKVILKKNAFKDKNDCE
jgi:hypothetical protein